MVRRIVTGNDTNGKAIVVSDGPTPHQWDLGRAVMDDVWVDDPALPYDNTNDPVAGGNFSLVGPTDGSVIRLVHFQAPDRTDMPSPHALEEARAHWDAGGLMEREDPAMHTTPTIDYGIVLEGEITLELDDGVLVDLHQGDIIVQRATRHAWRNRSGRVCTICFILITSPSYR